MGRSSSARFSSGPSSGGGRVGESSRLRTHTVRWILSVVVLGSVLALGSLHTPVLCVVAALAALAAAIAWIGAEPIRTRPAANILFAAGVGLVLWTAFQLVPLPASWLATIAPHTADIWARARAPLHLPGPPWAPLTLDPSATQVQLLRGVTYLCVFAAVVRSSARRNGTLFLERLLVASGLCVAVAALLHPALDADRVFGVYQPIYFHGAPGPLLNTNHLGAYLNIAFCVALASALSPAPMAPRPVLIAVVLVLVATQLKVASRGGVATMVLGAVLVGWMVRAAHKSLDPVRASRLPVAILLVAGVGIGVLSASDTAWNDLANTDISKLALFEQAARMLPAYALFGTGRGAFESTFPEFRTGSGHWLFTHPENIVLQWTLEWGVPIAVLAAIALAFALRPSVALARSVPAVGPWAALATVAIHNLVDFSSEVPGVVIAIAVCAGVVVGGSGGAERASRGLGAWARRPNLLGIGLAVSAAAALLGGLAAIDEQVYEERRALRELALDASVGRDRFRELLSAALLRHPAEPYVPFAGALRAARTGDESVVPWVARTLERAPVYGVAHALLARSLFTRVPSQARLEYRLAAEQYPAIARRLAREATPLAVGYHEALELVPSTPVGVEVLEQIASDIGDRLPATRARLDAEILARKPTVWSASQRVAEAAVSDLREDAIAPWCEADRGACVARAITLTKHLQAIAPNKADGYALEALARLEAGEKAKALSILSDACERVEDRPRCLLRFAELAALAGEETRVTTTLELVARAGCTDDSECVTYLCDAARFEERRGNPRRALVFYKRALERAPEREDVLLKVAELASRVGVHGESLEAYKKLAARHPEDARYKQAVIAEQQALFAEGIRR